MPVPLIFFGDKTQTNLHGSLAVTPITFTLSLFNRAARNNPRCWRPLAYTSNLLHGKGKKNKTTSIVKLQDEHKCLVLAFKSLTDLHQCRRGITMQVRGRFVRGRAWIHFFIGDTTGNNTWFGHYNGSGKLKSPYRDCRCTFRWMRTILIAHTLHSMTREQQKYRK